MQSSESRTIKHIMEAPHLCPPHLAAKRPPTARAYFLANGVSGERRPVLEEHGLWAGVSRVKWHGPENC